MTPYRTPDKTLDLAMGPDLDAPRVVHPSRETGCLQRQRFLTGAFDLLHRRGSDGTPRRALPEGAVAPSDAGHCLTHALKPSA